MGNRATYQGQFGFSEPITVAAIALVQPVLGKDLRDSAPLAHLAKHGLVPAADQYSIDLKFSADYQSLVWNGSESSFYYATMEDAIVLLTKLIRTVQPDFSFVGEMIATEEEGRKWKIKVEKDGPARVIQGRVVFDE